MRFLHPEFFLLLPALAALGWFWRGLKLQRPLRVLCLLAGVILLAQPQLRRAADGLDLWVLADRSVSADQKISPNLNEWLNLLEKSRGRHDRLRIVDFAEEALPREKSDGTSVFAGDKNATRVASALNHTLAQLDKNRPSRLLILTDGNSTEPLDGVAERLVREEVSLDFRIAQNDTAGDWGVEDFSAPSRVRNGESFLLSVSLHGPDGATAPVEIYRDGARIGESAVTVEGGKARLRFTDKIADGGAHRYEIRVLATNDTLPGNNTAGAWIEAGDGSQALLVTAYNDDPLKKILENQGMNVRVITRPKDAKMAHLSGAKIVILNNVPAYALDSEFLDAVPFFVTAQGGGFLMCGGKTSFASGGFFGSAVDNLLPVSMELRQEHRNLAVSMAIVLDRSGSMSASVPGTAQTKMDMANAGAAGAIQLLGDLDSVAVFAVDTEAHLMAPLSNVAQHREYLMNEARKIQSSGGGICVPTGLRAAQTELQKTRAGRRHIIVFADANDATQETGDYAAVIKKIRDDGITISVIGMGRDTDSGGDFLNEVAKLGEGRIFFNEKPEQLRSMFEQETVTVSRASFITDPVPLQETPGWLEIAARPLQWPAQIDGYNLCYLRENATAAAISGDEYNAPLTAFWQRGAGRSAAVTFPAGGEYSETVRAWQNYGDFWQTLARWLEGDKMPPGAAINHTVDGAKLRLSFRHDDTWLERLAMAPPKILAATGATQNTTEFAWAKIAPGHYQAMIDLPAGQWLRGAVLAGNFTFPFGPVSTAVNPEWQNDTARAREILDVARVSGGVERVDLASVWSAPRRAAWVEITDYLLLAFLAFFLLEILQNQTGILLNKRKI